MRSTKRIDPFLNEFGTLWKEKVPDWRFCQIMSNFVSWYGADIFYLEEDDFMKKFKQFMNEE